MLVIITEEIKNTHGSAQVLHHGGEGHGDDRGGEVAAAVGVEEDEVVLRGEVAVLVAILDEPDAAVVDVPLDLPLVGAAADVADDVAFPVEQNPHPGLDAVLLAFHLTPGLVDRGGRDGLEHGLDDFVPELQTCIGQREIADDVEEELCGGLVEVVLLHGPELTSERLALREREQTLERLEADPRERGHVRRSHPDDVACVDVVEPRPNALVAQNLERLTRRLGGADLERLRELGVAESEPRRDLGEVAEDRRTRGDAIAQSPLDLRESGRRILRDRVAQLPQVPLDVEAPQGGVDGRGVDVVSAAVAKEVVHIVGHSRLDRDAPEALEDRGRDRLAAHAVQNRG